MIKFQLAAWSETGGRKHNEDCFVVAKSVADGKWDFSTNETVSLGYKGSLMVVCDGMGGMSAGEVASALAVDTIKDWFSAEKINEHILLSPDSVQRYICKAIQAADHAIKEEAAASKAKSGMGSTLVMSWIVGRRIYIGWCGDSRAYRYNPESGLEQLTHDHSFVQELIDSGELDYNSAFEHPNSNIITRCLGDTDMDAAPETTTKHLHNDDVFLLCSDGLCGVLSEWDIEDIIAANIYDMKACREALISLAERKGWQDNVTLALCHIVEGGVTGSRTQTAIEPLQVVRPVYHNDTHTVTEKKYVFNINMLVTALCSVIILAAIAFVCGYFTGRHNTLQSIRNKIEVIPAAEPINIDENPYEKVEIGVALPDSAVVTPPD